MSINNQLNVSNSQSQVTRLQTFRAQQFCDTGARPSQGWCQRPNNFAPAPQPQQNMIQNLVEGMMKAFMAMLEKLIPALQGGANGNQATTDPTGPVTEPVATPPQAATPQPTAPVETTPTETAPVAPEQAAQCQKLEEEQKAQETSAGASEVADKPKNPVQNFINSLRESAGEFLGSMIGNILEGTKGPRRAIRKVRRALRQVSNLFKPKNLRGILSMATSFFGAGGSK